MGSPALSAEQILQAATSHEANGAKQASVQHPCYAVHVNFNMLSPPAEWANGFSHSSLIESWKSSSSLEQQWGQTLTLPSKFRLSSTNTGATIKIAFITINVVK